MGYRYEGDFFEGKRHGHGQELYKNGALYEGQFENNMKHGKGKIQFKDESCYEGDFLAGLPNGFGIYIAYSLERIMSFMPILDEK